MRVWSVATAIFAVALASSAFAQPLVNPPRLVSGPSDDEIAAAWPAAAQAAGITGEARIECQSPADGGLRDCKVLREAPAGQGFGEAALGLTSKFKVQPGTNNTRPVNGIVRFILPFPPRRSEVRDDQNSASYVLPEEAKPLTADEIYAAWPRLARSQTLEGDVTLSCLINLYGEVKDCQVTRESTPNFGFGAAAIELAKKMRYLPGTKDSMSVATRMPISVSFVCGDKCIPMRVPEGFHDTVVVARWVQTPTPAQVEAAYPKAALEANITGRVMMFCILKNDGGVRNCEVTTESPKGAGFAAAALSLASTFKTTPKKDQGGSGVQIPIAFSNEIGVPLIVQNPTPADLAPLLAEIGKSTDDVAAFVFRCDVAANGALSQCELASQTPVNADLAAAALPVASKFVVSQWGENGRPTVGSKTRVPLRIDLRPSQPKTEQADLVIQSPDWLRRPTGLEMERVYPNRAIREHMSGGATLTCKVSVDGSLHDCLATSESPPGFGFGAAALQLAPIFRMKPPMVNGLPVKLEGASVSIPVLFKTD